jgi:hypothetical protein
VLAQPVDATPSAINLFSKGGVYDASETSEAFRGAGIDMWCRWKAGQLLHEIGRAFGKDMCPFNLCCRNMEGLLRLLVGARCERLHWRSGKTFLEELLAAGRFVI